MFTLMLTYITIITVSFSCMGTNELLACISMVFTFIVKVSKSKDEMKSDTL